MTCLDLSYDGKVRFAAVDEDHAPFLLRAAGPGNPRLYLSYNVEPLDWSLINPQERGVLFGMESDYDDGSDHRKMEFYWQYQFASGFSTPYACTHRRSIMAQYDKVTNLPTVLFLSSGGPHGLRFSWNDGTGDPYQQQVVGKDKMLMLDKSFRIYNRPGGATLALLVDSSAEVAETGVTIRSGAAGTGAHINARSPAETESLHIKAKGEAGMLVLNQGCGPVIQFPGASVSLPAKGAFAVEATSDTELTLKLCGSDGVTRQAILALA